MATRTAFRKGSRPHGGFKEKRGRPSTLSYATTTVYILRVIQKYPKLRAPQNHSQFCFHYEFNFTTRSAAPLFNHGKHNLLVFPLVQCCCSKLALRTLCYLLTLQLYSIILINCFLFSLALLLDLAVLQVAVDHILLSPSILCSFSIGTAMKW